MSNKKNSNNKTTSFKSLAAAAKTNEKTAPIAVKEREEVKEATKPVEAKKEVEELLSIDPLNMDSAVNMEEMEEIEDQGAEVTILKKEDLKAERAASSTISKIQNLASQAIPAKFPLSVLPYKNTGCKIPAEFLNYIESDKDHLVFNELQKKEKCPGRISVVHLLEIIYTVLDVPHQQFKQSSGTKTSWGMLTKKDLDVKAIKEKPDYKMLEALGFRYDEASRKASYYRDQSNLDYLRNEELENVQAMYNRVVEATKKSHDLNSHNNMFTAIKNGQPSSFLIELNGVIQAL